MSFRDVRSCDFTKSSRASHCNLRLAFTTAVGTGREPANPAEESTEPRIDLPEVFLQSRIYRLQSKPSVYCSLAGNFGGTRALLDEHATRGGQSRGSHRLTCTCLIARHETRRSAQLQLEAPKLCVTFLCLPCRSGRSSATRGPRWMACAHRVG